jgi:enamine deaminase RidA (YjgF/YER057c/UK114 family)
MAGFSRATRRELGSGDATIAVSGTTASHGELKLGGDSAEAQAHFIIDKIAAAIESLGGKLTDVVRTRVYLNDVEAVCAYSRFGRNR